MAEKIDDRMTIVDNVLTHYKPIGDMSDFSVIIPKSVIRIEKNVFNGRTKLSEIIIPDDSSLIYIGNHAFDGCGLKSLNIPKSLITISHKAFYNCISLKSINIPNDSSLSIIGNNVFYGCISLESIDIPKSLNIISPCTFRRCKNLKSVNIPNDSSLTIISKDAFAGCEKLESIDIPKSLQIIDSNAFRSCTNLKSVNYALPLFHSNLSKAFLKNIKLILNPYQSKLPCGFKNILLETDAKKYSF